MQALPGLDPSGAPVLPPGIPRVDAVQILRVGAETADPRVQVVFWPGDEDRAERVADVLDPPPRLPWLPDVFPSQVVFYLAPDPETWDTLTGGRLPDWGAGVAIPERRMAALPLFEPPAGGLRDRDRTVIHEWAHLGLHEYLAGLRIPRWFDEGYAQRASGGWNIDEAWRLRVGLVRGGAPPLDSISLAWPRGRTGAELAYLLSGSAVEYLASVAGERGLEIFLGRWRELGDFEEAFRRTFGYTTGTFETRWIEHVRRRYGWVLVFTQTAVFWAFAALALLMLVKIRSQRNREQLARLRATQPPSRPAYWEGPRTPPIGGFGSDIDRSRRG